ncbi:rho GTPase-activating protein 19 isoform X1 [Leptidea sinapis]|uniref:rho GTPase-activating protein 19 isoform X1 n=1 Tax=Leptidea sinapis TaxID=189913 RepID=UPI00212C40F5|nr:rho GTPase-activating protein 19 isoform X1 [Leptidea sinapis]
MSTPDTQLIEKLRQENVEQFFILVRMHLSFVVDINTDDVDCSTDKPKQFRWNFNKKTKTSSVASSQNNTFTSKSISETNAITEEGISRLNELIDFLSKPTNVTQEGIFRRTGSLSRQQELRQLLQAGSNLGLDDGKFSVHDCASVLKGFLAELPQPLLMDQYYQTYCTLAGQYPPSIDSSEGKLLTALQLLLLLLTPTHRSFLERLLQLLTLVADNEASNRMSPDTLATMFTPHLLCPRKLSPENFHTDSIALSPVISFMIRHSARLFDAPNQLVTDAAAYFALRERKRIMSPDIDLDESITDRTAATTVYTFVDQHRTRAENETNPTDTALAQLYAHIQALPDSQHKRRLVKHFNRQNGYGTPIQIQRTGKAAASKSFGDSIKRHIFNKGLLNKTPKKGSSSAINTIEEKTKTKFKYSDDSKDVSHKSIVLKNLAQKMASTESLDDDYESDASNSSTLSEGALNKSKKMSPKFVSEPNLSAIDANDETPKNTKKRSRLFRSKVVSHSKKYQKRASARASCVSCVDHDSDNDVFVTETPSKNENYADGLEFKVHLTSTPGLCEAVFDDSTPYSEFRTSMSPITQSTQKLSKAMQESIMTPRSRKPLILTCEQRESIPESERDDVSDIYRSQSLSPRNDSDFVSSEDDVTRSSGDRSNSSNTSLNPASICPVRYQTSKWYTSTEKHLGLNTTLCGIDDLPQTNTHIPEEQSLSQPFKDYLLSRSVLTATPIDLSMLNKSSDDERISDSLLYCLDGNVPSDLASSISNLAVDSSVSQLRSPLKSIKNIDLSPSRKRCGSTTDLGTDSKKVIIEKENLNEAFELRETDL